MSMGQLCSRMCACLIVRQLSRPWGTQQEGYHVPFQVTVLLRKCCWSSCQNNFCAKTLFFSVTMSTAVCMYLLLSGFFRGRLVSSQAPVWFHSFSEVWYTMICGYALPGNYRSRDYSLPRRFKKEESNLSLETNTRSIPLNLILFFALGHRQTTFFF